MKLEVAILGATGAVGQRFIQLLQGHPWFEVAELVGSERSAGRRYRDVSRWVLDGSAPESVQDKIVLPLGAKLRSPIVFSALPKEAADPIEMELAAAGHVVCTNASANRMVADVPLLLPEVNPSHIHMVAEQRRRRGWSTGALIANSNCTIMPVVMALAPLREFGIQAISTVSAQAISGAGHPGVSALDILDNIIPFISGEEEKMSAESRKMLGDFDGTRFEDLEAVVSASCNRAPVLDGHLVNISVRLREQPSLEAVRAAWDGFRAPDPVPSLPSAPEHAVLYLEQQDRPQPRRDRMTGNGMTTTIGRLRECPILGYKFVALSHNTIRGAAGCSILNAEYLCASGYVEVFADHPVPNRQKASLASPV